MNGPAHYREAERLLESGEYGEYGEQGDTAAAQVHATLALAAATALIDGGVGDGCSMPHADWEAWHAAAGTPKGGTQ